MKSKTKNVNKNVKTSTADLFSKGKVTYTKYHTNPKAAAAHIARIKKRGGTVKKTISKGVIKVVSTY